MIKSFKVFSGLFILYLVVGVSPIIIAQQNFGLVIHGGAGYINPDRYTIEQELEYNAALQKALDSGYAALEKGGTAEEAVIIAISQLENSPLFNAGKGSVLNHDGEVEMDASIMLGKNLNAGAVAGVHTIKNPIKAAYLVMTESKHVMLAGDGADAFAKAQKLATETQEYFILESRKKSLEKILEKEKKHGTVGAVALDQNGNLAAGTSTGGMMNKKMNRIGDSPIIGAGTYAKNKTCAVSCTGHGEYFIRLAVSHEVSALMEHKGWGLEQATQHVIHTELTELGGDGGLIAIDKNGNISLEFNTQGMFRAYKLNSGHEAILMYGE